MSALGNVLALHETAERLVSRECLSYRERYVLVTEARAWIHDCFSDAPDDLGPGEVVAAVERFYEGGWAAFVASCAPLVSDTHCVVCGQETDSGLRGGLGVAVGAVCADCAVWSDGNVTG